jgi:predicted dehydrogenase
MKTIKVAVLGACGWMGKVHTNAYLNLERQFGNIGVRAEVRWVVDQNKELLEQSSRSISGCKISTDWHDAVSDPEIDLIDICLPDLTHYEAAKAALLNGKHVYCEKPLTDTLAQAKELTELALSKKVITRVGHSFPVNPAHRLARRLITSGEIGTVTFFRGSQHVDTHSTPHAPFIWRLDGNLAATGIVGDTGSHVFSLLDYLVGEVDELTAHCPIVFPERPEVSGAIYGGTISAHENAKMRAVTNPDLGIVMCRFKNGAVGTIDFSRIASGKKFEQRYDVFGTKGAISYDYDQITRLKVYRSSADGSPAGYQSIDVGPEMPEYAAYLPLANFGLGYNEIKTYEVREVVESIASGQSKWPTFQDGKRIVAVTEACMKSHKSNGWVKVDND